MSVQLAKRLLGVLIYIKFAAQWSRYEFFIIVALLLDKIIK